MKAFRLFDSLNTECFSYNNYSNFPYNFSLWLRTSSVSEAKEFSFNIRELIFYEDILFNSIVLGNIIFGLIKKIF